MITAAPLPKKPGPILSPRPQADSLRYAAAAMQLCGSVYWNNRPMLHPSQFEVNEAWIAFRLNHAPVRTVRDGDFNCIALMDAASCFILCFEFAAADATQLSQMQSRRLLEKARSHKQQLPRTLFVPTEDAADLLTSEATRQGIDVVRVAESELLIFVGEAREGFAERFAGP